jgi:protein-S-isoprenylcysteine O-methyltransferase Ste14
MITYDTIFFVSWAAFLLVWGISAFFVKQDARGGGWQRFWVFWVLRLAAAAIIIFAAVRLGRRASFPAAVFFSHPLFTPTLILGWAGALLTAIGIGFAIWARVNLGRNWSSRPTVKEQHELVTTGPYAYVRHPIYSGIMLAALGTALVTSIFGICMLIFISIFFALRMNKEEKIMLELFPEQYPEYQKQTKRLVPFVW